MARGDRTGPAGTGPRTGRAAGYCSGYDVPGFMNPLPGRRGWFGPGYDPASYPTTAAYGGPPYGPPGRGAFGWAGRAPWFGGRGFFGRRGGFGLGPGRGFGGGRGPARGRRWFGW